MRNTINQGGYLPELFYYGDGDADLELLINKIKNINERHFFTLEFTSKISFTADKVKELFASVETRK